MKTTKQIVQLATNNEAPRNQGRQRMAFGDSPFFHFCLKQFYQIAKKYPAKEISRIGVVLDKENGVVAFGTPTLLELFSIAANPKQINPHKPSPLFLTCFKNSPDFTLALISRIRNQLAKCSAEKRGILFGIDNGLFTDREKTERSALRKLIVGQNESHQSAHSRLLEKVKK
jgi:hypothetical protein